MQTVLNPDTADLADIYDNILVPSFHEDQMESLEEIITGVQKNIMYVIALKDDKHGYVAATVNYWYEQTSTLLVAYLAVSKKKRAKGLGTQVLHFTVEALETMLKPSLILCEANDPEFDAGSENYGDPSRRMKFYKNYGARIVDVPYFQAGPGLPIVMVNMWLLILPGKYPAGNVYNENREIKSSALHDFFLAYMEQDEEPEDADPALTALFESLKRPWIPTKEIQA